MSMLYEKLREYKGKVEKLKTERKERIDEKVIAYRQSLENEPDTEIEKLTTVVEALQKVVDYENTTQEQKQDVTTRPGMQVFGTLR